MSKEKRQYVVVEGGLVQYGSDSVDVIDLDIFDSGDWDADTLEQAEHYLSIMDAHGFVADSYDRTRLKGFINSLRADLEADNG